MKNPVQEAIITALAEKTGLLPGCKRLGMDVEINDLMDFMSFVELFLRVANELGISKELADAADWTEIDTISEFVRMMTVSYICQRIANAIGAWPLSVKVTTKIGEEVDELTHTQLVIELETVFDLPAADLHDRSVWAMFQTPPQIIEYFLKQLGIDEVGERDLATAMAVG